MMCRVFNAIYNLCSHMVKTLIYLGAMLCTNIKVNLYAEKINSWNGYSVTTIQYWKFRVSSSYFVLAMSLVGRKLSWVDLFLNSSWQSKVR